MRILELSFFLAWCLARISAYPLPQRLVPTSLEKSPSVFFTPMKPEDLDQPAARRPARLPKPLRKAPSPRPKPAVQRASPSRPATTPSPSPKRPLVQKPPPKRPPVQKPRPKKPPVQKPPPTKTPVQEPPLQKPPVQKPLPKKPPIQKPPPKKAPVQKPPPKEPPVQKPPPKTVPKKPTATQPKTLLNAPESLRDEIDPLPPPRKPPAPKPPSYDDKKPLLPPGTIGPPTKLFDPYEDLPPLDEADRGIPGYNPDGASPGRTEPGDSRAMPKPDSSSLPGKADDPSSSSTPSPPLAPLSEPSQYKSGLPNFYQYPSSSPSPNPTKPSPSPNPAPSESSEQERRMMEPGGGVDSDSDSDSDSDDEAAARRDGPTVPLMPNWDDCYFSGVPGGYDVKPSEECRAYDFRRFLNDNPMPFASCIQSQICFDKCPPEVWGVDNCVEYCSRQFRCLPGSMTEYGKYSTR